MSSKSKVKPDWPSVLAESVEAPAGMSRKILDFVSESRRLLASVPNLDLTATDAGVSRVAFGSGRNIASGRVARRYVEQARAELEEYFAAERSFFSVPVDLSGVAPFQRAVLDVTAGIPMGEVRSYRDVASGVGNDRAVRACGTALGRNPVPLIVPCHRVVRSDGSIGQYAGGTSLKQQLLLLEREMPGLVGCPSTRRLCRLGCAAPCPEPAGARVAFSSAEAAAEQGYRPCDRCLPRVKQISRPGV